MVEPPRVVLLPAGEKVVRELAGPHEPAPVACFAEPAVEGVNPTPAGVSVRYVLGWPGRQVSGRLFLPWGFIAAVELDRPGFYQPA